MTQTPETPEDRLARTEEILNRAARLTLQNTQAIAGLEANSARHDEALAQLLEATSRNTEAAARHDEALAQLLEATNRNTESAARHDEAISKNEEVLARLLEVTSWNLESVTRHGETLSQLEANVARHEENFLRIEAAIIDVANKADRNERGIEALRTTAAETLQLVAEQARLHAQHREEIEEIWRYLRYEPRNGNGRGD
jgi:hypothetical protein